MRTNPMKGKSVSSHRQAERSILFTILLLVSIAPLSSEEVQLKNGKSIFGRIIGQSRTTITVQKSDGSRDVIQKNTIHKISYDAVDPEIEQERQQRKRAEEERIRKQREREAELQRQKEAKEQEEIREKAKKALEAEEERQRIETQKRKEEAERLEAQKREEEAAKVAEELAPETSILDENLHMDLGIRYGTAKGSTGLAEIYTSFNTLRVLGSSSTHAEFFLPTSLESQSGKAASIYANMDYKRFFGGLERESFQYNRSLSYLGIRAWEDSFSSGQAIHLYERDISPSQSDRSYLFAGYSPLDFSFLSAGILIGMEQYSLSMNPGVKGFEIEQDNGTGKVTPGIIGDFQDSGELQFNDTSIGFRFSFFLPDDIELDLKLGWSQGTGTFKMTDGTYSIYLDRYSDWRYSSISLSGNMEVEGKSASLEASIPIQDSLRFTVAISTGQTQTRVTKMDMIQVFEIDPRGANISGPDEMFFPWFYTNFIAIDSFSGLESNSQINAGIAYRLDFSGK